jgi:hypothetical protein
MSDKQAFIIELARQESSDGIDPTSQTVGTALDWEFRHTSETVEGLESSGLVTTTMAARRSGDTHLDDWVNLTAEGKALVQALRLHGLRTRDVLTSFDTLKRTGFVDAQLHPDNGGEYSFIRLSEKGLHATGLWPTPETALDRMIAALDTIAANSSDEDTRTKAQKFAAWLRASGTTVGISVASTVLTGQIPGSQ